MKTCIKYTWATMRCLISGMFACEKVSLAPRLWGATPTRSSVNSFGSYSLKTTLALNHIRMDTQTSTVPMHVINIFWIVSSCLFKLKGGGILVAMNHVPCNVHLAVSYHKFGEGDHEYSTVTAILLEGDFIVVDVSPSTHIHILRPLVLVFIRNVPRQILLLDGHNKIKNQYASLTPNGGS